MKTYDYNKKYFETGMTGWHASSYPKIANRLHRQVGARQFKRGLDVGCGDGFYGKLLKKNTDELWGTDLANCLDQSDNRHYYEGFIQANLETPMETNGKFDLIFCSEVIEHVENFQPFLSGLHAALAPGGLLFLTTTTYPCYLPIYLTRHPRTWSAKEIGSFFLGWIGFNRHRKRFVLTLWDWTKGHYHGFSRRRMINAARTAGFKVETVEYMHAQPIIETQFFHNPFKNVPFRPLLLPLIRLWGMACDFLNVCCAKFDFYGRNVILIATKLDT
jgi:2-polyprenyl-3-methyl-5-hydroxy-6-metoxy-1,4-benzoquinol methylase